MKRSVVGARELKTRLGTYLPYLQRETGQRVLFAAFDERLNNAARAEGLTLASRG